MNYQVIEGAIKLTKDDLVLFIAPDPANTDYQEYLAWLDEGNEPLPADSE